MQQGIRFRVDTTWLVNKNSQHNQLKLRPNAFKNVKACAVIEYTNLEHGQLKHQTICQEGTNTNAAVLKCIPRSPALLHCTDFQYHLNALKNILLVAKLPHVTILRSHQLPVWMHLTKL